MSLRELPSIFLMDLTQCLGMAGAVTLADALDNSVILVNPEDCERPEVNFKQVTA